MTATAAENSIKTAASQGSVEQAGTGQTATTCGGSFAPASKLPKPDWLRIKAAGARSEAYEATAKILHTNKCVTVCEAAACPNARECWSKKHAAFMILGEICTRKCPFCNVKKGKPYPGVDADEPARLAKTVAELQLKHVVITSVTRDDLPDGGAEQFVKCIEEIRKLDPHVIIEVLTPDFAGKPGAIETIVAARPRVYNHNLEVVPRLYPIMRPATSYKRSLVLLRRVKEMNPAIFTKSGIMLGVGEERDEVIEVMDDMRAHNIDFMVMGQYLQPSPVHAEVLRYVHPDEFAEFASIAKSKGFTMVSAAPFARSSFHADEDFDVLAAAADAEAGKRSLA